MNNRMNQQEVAKQLQLLNSKIEDKWLLSDDHIKKECKFSDFKQALDFMLAVGQHAEDLQHHPEWCNVYNKVRIELTTHSVNGITELDFKLAHKIEEVLSRAQK